MNIVTNAVPAGETPEQRRNRWKNDALLKWNNLSFWQRWRMRHGTSLHVANEPLMPENINNNPATELYLFYCAAHRSPDIDYAHGYRGRLECNLCRRRLSRVFKSPPVSPPIRPVVA